MRDPHHSTGVAVGEARTDQGTYRRTLGLSQLLLRRNHISPKASPAARTALRFTKPV